MVARGAIQWTVKELAVISEKSRPVGESSPRCFKETCWDMSEHLLLHREHTWPASSVTFSKQERLSDRCNRLCLSSPSSTHVWYAHTRAYKALFMTSRPGSQALDVRFPSASQNIDPHCSLMYSWWFVSKMSMDKQEQQDEVNGHLMDHTNYMCISGFV